MFIVRIISTLSFAILAIAGLSLGIALANIQYNQIIWERNFWIPNIEATCVYTKYVLVTSEPPWIVDIYGHLQENLTLAVQTQLTNNNFTNVVNTSICPSTKQLLWDDRYVNNSDINIFRDVAELYPLNKTFNCTVNNDCTKMWFPVSGKDLYLQETIFLIIMYGCGVIMFAILVIAGFCISRFVKDHRERQQLLYYFDAVN